MTAEQIEAERQRFYEKYPKANVDDPHKSYIYSWVGWLARAEIAMAEGAVANELTKLINRQSDFPKYLEKNEAQPASEGSPTPRTRPVVIHFDDEMGGLECVGLSDYEKLETELDAAKAELKQWAQWGIIEVAIRNPSVADYMKHWEGRAEKAELQRDTIKQAWIKECERSIAAEKSLAALQARIEKAEQELAAYVDIDVAINEAQHALGAKEGESLVATAHRIADELAALHTRLEDNFCYDIKGNRVEVEAGSIPDGITCRDETIKLQNESISKLYNDLAALQARIEEAGKELPPYPEKHWIPIEDGTHPMVDSGDYDTLRQQYTDLLAKSKGDAEDARRYDLALKRIQMQAYSDSSGEELEDAQRDLRIIHKIASDAIERKGEG